MKVKRKYFWIKGNGDIVGLKDWDEFYEVARKSRVAVEVMNNGELLLFKGFGKNLQFFLHLDKKQAKGLYDILKKCLGGEK